MIKANIVIIDSGVDKLHESLEDADISGIAISNESELLSDYSDNLGHGTAVTSIVHNHTANIKIFVIKVFGKELSTQPENLIKALEYIEESVECEIINMSLGIRKHNEDLHRICNKIIKKGVIIVSAFDNSGAVSYPAAYDGVIGVDISRECKSVYEYIIIKNNMVNILGMGLGFRVAWLNNKYKKEYGSSFTTAYITTIIYNLLEKGRNGSALYQVIEENAKSVIISKNHNIYNINIEEQTSNNISVFPFNKEIHSVIRFSDLLKYNLSSVYDIKQSGNIGDTIINLSGTQSYTIEDIKNIDYNKFDTLIIGHLDQLNNHIGNNYKNKLLEDCLKNKKNVMCFDCQEIDKYFEKYQEAGLLLWWPEKNINIDYNKMGKLFDIESPVLCVFGTSGRQGKFTIQLILRKIFMSNGYSVGQLGTEPSGILFGMNETIPFGYNASLPFHGLEFIEYTNSIMHKIDISNPDIIISGGQSGSIPLVLNNIGQIPLPQIEFCMGVKPDAVILCVNISDQVDYIIRTINGIESLADCRVIAICIFPYNMDESYVMKAIDNETLGKEKIKLSNKIKLPTFITSYKQDMDGLFNVCIAYFSNE